MYYDFYGLLFETRLSLKVFFLLKVCIIQLSMNILKITQRISIVVQSVCSTDAT